MSEGEKKEVLIISFDGLDYELIQEFDLETIPQKEFGTLDNDTDIRYRKTFELYASFITGETWREHGVIGIRKWKNPLLEKFESWARQYRFFKKWNEVRKRIYLLLLGENLRVKQNRHDLNCPSIFDRVDNSKALNVPSWNPSHFGIENAVGDPDTSAAELFDTYEHQKRRKELLEDGSIPYYDLVMAHFDRPDAYQHIYEGEEKEELRDLYHEIDELAAEIIDRFEDDFDTIIFMSDHGRVTEHSHNKQAFYSCNEDLFPDKTPHITDFHDEVLKRVKGEDAV